MTSAPFGPLADLLAEDHTVAAVARIAETDPWLGRHLRDHIHSGWECRYESDPDHPVRWAPS